MSYTYGMKGAPAVGNGLGGLPRKQAALGLQSTYTRIVSGSGVLNPPANAKFMRVAVIGGGGGGGARSEPTTTANRAGQGGAGGQSRKNAEKEFKGVKGPDGNPGIPGVIGLPPVFISKTVTQLPH
jgi:hypothetical protein